jgi:hypothetical protein
MARLSARDAARWRALAGRVAGLVERALSPRVLANRVLGGGAGWVLEPVGPALRRARAVGDGLAATGITLRTDIAAFYASVTPSILAGALRAVGAGRGDATVAGNLLEGWGSEGYGGLPIGPPSSAVMANAVLAGADRSLRRFPFVRWVDDYLVSVPHDRAVGEALDELDEALAGLGLARSEGKTVVGEGDRGWLRPGSAAPAGRIAAP